MKITRKEIGIILLLCLPALVFLIIPHIQSSSPNKIQLSSNTELMEQEVLKYIPVGTEIHKAKNIMEQNGFGCSTSVDGTIISNHRLKKTNTRGKKTTLSCVRKAGWLVSNVWRIDLSYQNHKVTDMAVFFRSTASDL